MSNKSRDRGNSKNSRLKRGGTKNIVNLSSNTHWHSDQEKGVQGVLGRIHSPGWRRSGGVDGFPHMRERNGRLGPGAQGKPLTRLQLRSDTGKDPSVWIARFNSTNSERFPVFLFTLRKEFEFPVNDSLTFHLS